MARIRSVKPEFWTDPDVVALPMVARLFLIGCLNFADDYGVLRDDPARLKLQIMPADDIDASAVVDALVEARFLVRMIAPDETKVLVIRTFVAHQKIDKRAVGRWGAPDDFTLNPHQSPPIPTNPAPGREGKGGDGSGEENILAIADRRPRYSEPFASFYGAYPRKQKPREAERAHANALKRATADEIKVGLAASIEVWATWPADQRQFIPYPASWLNADGWLTLPEHRTANTKQARDRAALVEGAERPDLDIPWAERVAGQRAGPALNGGQPTLEATAREAT